MSRHQLYRNYDYENEMDDYDGGGQSDGEEGGLSAEDQALMTEGTAQVQQALGSEAAKVTVAQIQEALWHYYYDVDKSVAYLIGKFISPTPKATPKKTKAPDGKWRDLFLSPGSVVLPEERIVYPRPQSVSPVGCVPCIFTKPIQRRVPPAMNPSLSPPRSSGVDQPVNAICQGAPQISYASFFSDMPWLNIPQHRRTVFIKPRLPRGGLLGGSGAPPKMSKLQALAAARRKKSDDSKSSDRAEEAGQSLKKLSIQERRSEGSSSSSLSEAQTKRRRLAEGSRSSASLDPPTQPNPPGGGDSMDVDVGGSAEPVPAVRHQAPEAPRAAPSSFAQTLFGSASGRVVPPPVVQRFSLPYLSFAPSCVEDAFSDPSPDDVVLAAQAKGSLAGTAKKK